MKLAGRVAIVTGTSPNIGGGIAEALAAEGARVACVDRDERNAEDCAAGIRKLGGEALAVTRRHHQRGGRRRRSQRASRASSAPSTCW